jgi:regulator of replication initiation timing
MEIFIAVPVMAVVAFIVKYVDSLKKEIKELNNELDMSLYNNAKLYYENEELQNQVNALKKDQHQMKLKISEYESKIKKITTFFNS